MVSVVVALLVGFSFSCVLFAAPPFILVDSEGFEEPLNSINFDADPPGPGPEDGPFLEGQPAQLFDASMMAAWQASGIPTGTANVVNTQAATGTQSVEVTRAANADDRWSREIGAQATNPGPLPYDMFSKVFIEWDMYITDPSPVMDQFGPVFGIEAYDASAAIELLGFLGVDSATQELLYQEQATGFFTTIDDGAGGSVTVDYDEWNHFEIFLDFAQQQYRVSLNGSPLHTEGFVDGPLAAFTDADIAALAGAGNAESLAATGTAYFDNYIVYQIPEPAALILAMAVAGVLATRRRIR
jgi:hypothetical protein